MPYAIYKMKKKNIHPGYDVEVQAFSVTVYVAIGL